MNDFLSSFTEIVEPYIPTQYYPYIMLVGLIVVVWMLEKARRRFLAIFAGLNAFLPASAIYSRATADNIGLTQFNAQWEEKILPAIITLTVIYVVVSVGIFLYNRLPKVKPHPRVKDSDYVNYDDPQYHYGDPYVQTRSSHNSH